jgi:hypothetical protein
VMIKAVDNRLSKTNYNIHQFDQLIEDWESGNYTNGVKQPKIVLPHTWKK